MIDRVLVVDDELLIRQLMEETLTRQGIEVITASSAEEAMGVVTAKDFQMIFSDLRMGRRSGIDFLRFCSEKCPGALFVIMTAYGTVEDAVEAMKLGAFDFVIKPFSPDQTDVMLEKAKRWLGMRNREKFLMSEAASPSNLCQKAIGESQGMIEAARLVARVARTDTTVLVTGESGTGKELIASEIHRLSDPEGTKPFIKMNCAAVPEALAESELFGHEKGAFTGAVERRVGRFELADGGTLLLDEIGEVSPAIQAKLLRVLQTSEFERVGGVKTVKVRTRVVATTNRDLRKEVDEGRFRADLFYRLNVFPVHLPPLRERGGDIPLLATHFIGFQSERLRRSLKFTEAALSRLSAYRWPGNIRELENVIERIAILEDGPLVDESALPPEIVSPGAGGRSGTSGQRGVGGSGPDYGFSTLNLEEIERSAIEEALRRTGGNRLKAAELLGFSVRTLRNKLNAWKGMAAAEPRDGVDGLDE